MSNLRSALTLPKLKAEDINEEYDLVYIFKPERRCAYTMTIPELRRLLAGKGATKPAKVVTKAAKVETKTPEPTPEPKVKGKKGQDKPPKAELEF